MLSQHQKWNRRQFQAILLGGLLLSQGKTSTQASSLIKPASQMLVEANNSLALSLLRELDVDKDKNHFLSPFSIQSALSMAVEGARGETAAEMGKALQYPEAIKQPGKLAWDMSKLRNDFRAASERMRPDDSAKANQVRAQITKLRTQLANANEQSTALASAQKYKEANAKSTAAKKLADQINELAKQVDQYEL
ncbi:MAG: serpin family protein, partial [Pirellulaceae bacterium]|nr:serpin family protein [Pirellulaceae bacterium]